MRQTRCVDCNGIGLQTPRPALNPGPRCDEHHRAVKRKRSQKAHGNRIQKAFGITSAMYNLLYEYQKAYIATLLNDKGEPLSGVCYGCGKAKGLKRRLAIDHDHECLAGHAPEVGCPRCIRALLCTYCNEILGRLDALALARLIEVLKDPPAQRILGRMAVIEDDGRFDR